MSNTITITPPPGLHPEDMRALFDDLARWTVWADAHDVIEPLTITVQGGPWLAEWQRKASVDYSIRKRLAETVRVEGGEESTTDTGHGSVGAPVTGTVSGACEDVVEAAGS